MATKREPPRCTYCGSAHDLGRDHIPPKGLFPDDPRHRADLVTVPACRRCNTKFSAADEYFAMAIASHMLTGTNPIAATLHARAKRGFERMLRGRRGHRIRREFQLIEQRTPAGLYVGHQSIWRWDRPTLHAVAGRILKGLHFHHFRRPVGKGVVAKVGILVDIPQRTAQDDVVLQPIRDTLATTAIHNIGDGVFRYRFGVAEDNPDVSLWLMIFYDAVEFAGTIGIP